MTVSMGGHVRLWQCSYDQLTEVTRGNLADLIRYHTRVPYGCRNLATSVKGLHVTSLHVKQTHTLPRIYPHKRMFSLSSI